MANSINPQRMGDLRVAAHERRLSCSEKSPIPRALRLSCDKKRSSPSGKWDSEEAIRGKPQVASLRIGKTPLPGQERSSPIAWIQRSRIHTYCHRGTGLRIVRHGDIAGRSQRHSLRSTLRRSRFRLSGIRLGLERLGHPDPWRYSTLSYIWTKYELIQAYLEMARGL